MPLTALESEPIPSPSQSQRLANPIAALELMFVVAADVDPFVVVHPV